MPLLAAVVGQAAYGGDNLPKQKVSPWLRLADQALNAAIIAAIPVLPTFLLADFNWRVPVISFATVFLSKLALYRGINGR